MADVDKKQVLIAALVGGAIFCLVVLFVDYILGRGFKWERLGFYYIFAFFMYGFLTYRNLKKQNKNK